MKPTKPWFIFDNRGGDRYLSSQLLGLGLLQDSVRGKTVLDVGCAEGLISLDLVARGAVAVHGVEIRPQAVIDANKLRGDLPCTFEEADANTWAPRRSYDVVLMLALLHKLKDPSAACARFAEAARELVVIRLPPHNENPTVVDARSGYKVHDIGKVMTLAGFKLKHWTDGFLNEWVGYYERPRDV